MDDTRDFTLLSDPVPAGLWSEPHQTVTPGNLGVSIKKGPRRSPDLNQKPTQISALIA
jgi:hypothetical protein